MVPGDTILISDGTMYVNGSVSEMYPKGIVFEYAGTASVPITLDSDEYFVIGDNILESKDSRYPEVGLVQADTILGKIIG